jgi:hypothetical protein
MIGMYTELARINRGEMLARHSNLADRFNWDGHFETSKGSGRADLMHYDLEGYKPNVRIGRGIRPPPSLKAAILIAWRPRREIAVDVTAVAYIHIRARPSRFIGHAWNITRPRFRLAIENILGRGGRDVPTPPGMPCCGCSTRPDRVGGKLF